MALVPRSGFRPTVAAPGAGTAEPLPPCGAVPGWVCGPPAPGHHLHENVPIPVLPRPAPRPPGAGGPASPACCPVPAACY